MQLSATWNLNLKKFLFECIFTLEQILFELLRNNKYIHTYGLYNKYFTGNKETYYGNVLLSRYHLASIRYIHIQNNDICTYIKIKKLQNRLFY